ncbi:MAG TPA: alginate lyase family protein [Trebonia sp.]|nr:alginate lyase family protein [Trebonia sp.]
MSPGEVAWRVWEQALRQAWSRRQVRPGRVDGLAAIAAPSRPGEERRFASVLPPDAASGVPAEASAAIVAAANRIMNGEWEMLGVLRMDMKEPDWFLDQATGRRSAPNAYAFGIDHRDEATVGNIKCVWELSRLQHLTLLATAWYLTRDDTYAVRVDAQLRAWWRDNPFLSGVNWTSGIEVGLRLMNWAWIRRLLDEWPDVASLFEGNDLALHQLRWHQQYLAAFESRGSSANNHLIAEAAGLLAASCAFPWFAESDRWRRRSRSLLEKSLRDNTFPSGINRELASDYHGFVFELGVFAAVEASAAGAPVSDDCQRLLCGMADCMAALVDTRLRPPRQGDSDEGRVVLLDAPEHNRWPALLSLAAALFGPLDWWPQVRPDAGSVLAVALTGGERAVAGRPAARPSRFADAGIAIIRTSPSSSPEIWCRCDGGPHGFLSIAAHAHADALSVEVRCDGVDILADPGTYCYHGEPEWRSYFRSTLGHNTVQLGGRDQSQQSGPFMWARQARTRQIPFSGPETAWTAEHDGYALLNPAARHRRSVRLDQAGRTLEITDVIDPGDGHDLRMALHLGPDVTAGLAGDVATLSWAAADGGGSARLELPGVLDWSLHRGETDPILGWYSAGLGERVPAVTLLGYGRCTPGAVLMTRLSFTGSEISLDSADSPKAVSLGAPGARCGKAPENDPEAR